jgi:chromosome segregation ATPase
MTLIRKQLYKDLVAVRETILKQLEDVTNELNAVKAELAVEQKFADGFAKTQSDLEASIKALEEKVVSNENSVKDLSKKYVELQSSEAEGKANVKEAEANLREQLDILEELKKSGASATAIANQQAVVNSGEAVLDSKVKNVDLIKANIEANQKAQEDLKRDIVVSREAISESQKQKADNEERKSESDQKIKDLTDNETRITAKKNEVQSQLDEFLAKNQDTINSFEEQQLKRDKNIRRDSSERVLFRQPANHEVIKAADEVMSEVVGDEFSATETEKDQRKTWVEAGRKADINPSYLSAQEAQNLTLSSIWSTKKVAKQIQDACIAGEFQTECGSLSNSVIFALQQAGFKIYLTESVKDKLASVVISWENISSAS